VARRTEVYAALAFAAAWLASLGIMQADGPPIAIVPCVAVGLVAWWVGLRANLRLGRERLRDRPETASGLPRPRVARAIWLSWLLPGLGELYLGLPHWPAFRVLAAYLATAIPVWTSIVPAFVGIAFALPVWIWGQSQLRRGSGWGWSPLLPAWGEVLARGSAGGRSR
jgi:hypothetical protein